MEICNSSFIDLENEYIVGNIDKCYPLLLKYFSEWKDDSGIIRVLDIAFGPFLVSFSLDESDEKLLRHICPVTKKYFIQILEKFKSFREDGQLDISQESILWEKIISILMKAIETHTSEVSKVDIMKVRSLLMCSSEVLFEFYGFYSKAKQSNEHPNPKIDYLLRSLAPVLTKSQNLQENLFHLLSKIEIASGENAIDVLDDVLTLLYKSAMSMTDFDVRTMVDLWKGYISILEIHYGVLQKQHDISIAIGYLSENLVKKLEVFIPINSIDLPIKNINELIKIFSCNLKVIIKIIQKFTRFSKNCIKSLINLLVSLNWIRHVLHKTHHSNVESLTLLATGLNPLLNCLMNDMDFFHEVSSFLENPEMNEYKRYSLFLLLPQIVEKLTFASQETRILWFGSDNNILSWIFNFLSKCNIELCSDFKYQCKQIPGKPKEITDFYGHLLMKVSAFLITTSGRQFSLAEKILIKNILGVNPWCAILAADIWCILVRFADSELCYQQLIELVKILNYFGIWSELPQKNFLESLIKRLFPLMSEKHKNLFIENHPREKYQNLWTILEISSSSEKLKILNSLANKFLNSGRNFNEKDFEEMKFAFTGFPTEISNFDDEFEGNLLNLWKFNSIKLTSNPLSKHYLKFLCSMTESSVSFISSPCIQQILHEIKSSLENFNPIIKCYCVEILLKCSMREQFVKIESIRKLISSLFYNFLTDQNVFIRLISIDKFAKFAYSTSQVELIPESINHDLSLKSRIVNYFQKKHPERFQEIDYEESIRKLKNSNYKHYCLEDHVEIESYSNDCREPPCKKIILEKNEENNDLENLIIILRRDVEKIRQRAKDLTANQNMEISGIADMLRDIVKVHYD